MMGYGTPASRPWWRCTSVPQTSLATVSSTASPGPGRGPRKLLISTGRPGPGLRLQGRRGRGGPPAHDRSPEARPFRGRGDPGDHPAAVQRAPDPPGRGPFGPAHPGDRPADDREEPGGDPPPRPPGGQAAGAPQALP